jgi:peptidoglycan/LPS O-acetylase OafA/YrhL
MGISDGPSTRKSRIPVLDGLRGIAIILVLIWHYFCCQVNPRNALLYAGYKIFEWSWSGVDLFFVLSGFLIGGIILDQRNSANLLPVFYWRRALRILPLYFVCVGLFFLIKNCGSYPINPFKVPWLFDNSTAAWPYPFFMQNFVMALNNSFGARWLSVTWSVAVEEQFYLLLPFVILRCPINHLSKLLIGLAAITPVLRILISVIRRNTFPCYVLLISRADPLLMGVLLAFIVRQPHGLTAKSQAKLWVAFVLLAGVTGLLSFYSGNLISLNMVAVGYYIIALLFTCLLALTLISKGTLLEKVLSNKVLMVTGRISYCIYLIHIPVLGLIHSYVLHSPPHIDSLASAAVTIFALLITVTIALLSWHFFELPLLNLAHRWKYRPAIVLKSMPPPAENI